MADAVRAARDARGIVTPSPDSSALPIFDAPCEGIRVRGADDLGDPEFAGSTYVICHLAGGDMIGLREDLPTSHPTAGVYPFPGALLAGGPLGRSQGVLLYLDDGALRWTTSHRTARELSRGALLRGLLGRGPESESAIPRLAFGHAAWGPGQLEAEIAAGAWKLVAPQSSR
ncbi:MAG: YqgE/AlgH family protein [Deltaproteobacteria bacterium]|nr:YqgE/AlgH family protein [Deltaproteobacteria bacterium]